MGVMKRVWDYVIISMNGMAYGLFATLIIGVIFDQIGKLSGFVVFSDLGGILKGLTHVGIGVGIAWALKFDGIKMICVAAAGGLCGAINDPFVTYFVVICASLVLRYVLLKKTPLDIVLVPLISLFISYIFYLLIADSVHLVTTTLGEFVHSATTKQPFVMGIVVSVLMGMALTAPISSAAIAIGINLDGIAGGAAVVGCCVQMLGFAVMSRKDNNIGMVISVAIGTSMLQFKNILKKPIIWLPPIIVSAILGPIATVVFELECTKFGAGMGTSGFVGQIQTFGAAGANAFWGVVILEILAPLVLVFGIDILFRRFGLIKDGDLKI